MIFYNDGLSVLRVQWRRNPMVIITYFLPSIPMYRIMIQIRITLALLFFTRQFSRMFKDMEEKIVTMNKGKDCDGTSIFYPAVDEDVQEYYIEEKIIKVNMTMCLYQQYGFLTCICGLFYRLSTPFTLIWQLLLNNLMIQMCSDYRGTRACIARLEGEYIFNKMIIEYANSI